MALTITIPGAIEATTGATAPAVLTIGVGIPGPGVPTGGTAGQVLKKLSSTNYDTAWQTDLNSGVWGTITGTLSNQTDLQTALNLKADLASPALTGVPTAPTAATLTSTTQLATTAFVQQELAAGTAVAKNLEVYVRNQSGSTITAGSIVYISGATGNRPLITLAQANNDANSAQTMGFVKSTIANNGTGYVIVRGVLENIDTSALSEGVQLYLSPTTAGTWTTTKPYAPQHLVYVGVVIRSHPTLGTILVAIQNGYELDELHNVAAQTPSDLDLLSYESSTSLWKNKSFSTLGLLTSANAATTYYPLSGNPSGFLTSASLSGYAQLSGATFTGEVATPASTTTTAGFSIAPGTAPTSPTNGEIWNTGTDIQVRIAGVTETLAEQSWVTTQLGSYLTTATAASTYAPIASPGLTGNVTITTNSASPALIITQDGAGDIIQFKDVTSDTTYAFIDANGKVSTIAATTANAGFNIAHGAAPTTPANGDIWTTTSGLFMRQNGTTQQYVDLAGTQTISGSKTFSNASLTLGNSTAASTYNLGTGATLTATTKAINIGTNGVAGSTTNIAIGSTTGTSTTTLQGTTNGVTAAADTNSVALATTAFVVGQAGSATPLMDNGTAVVGTSLRYARQDHVHPTDTSRAPLASPTFTGTVTIPAGASISGFAPLASPTFTGTPAAPTATAGTNTTQIATTAFVTAAVPSFAATADINSPSSTTKVMSPSNVVDMITSTNYQLLYLGAGVSGTSGTGGYFGNNGGRWHDLNGPSAAVSGYGAWCFDTNSSSYGYVGSKIGGNIYDRDYSKKIWLSGRSMIGHPTVTSLDGDINTWARISLGGKNSFSTGDISSAIPGFGWKLPGGGASALILQVSNGTAVTSVTSSFTPTLRQMFDWKIYSDGAGNVTLYVNGSSVATTSAGPSGSTNAGLYFESVDATGGHAKALGLNTVGTKIYFST